MKKSWFLLGGLGLGAGLGAGLVYLLDPGAGRRRRAVIRDHTNAYLSEVEEKAARVGRKARELVSGARDARPGEAVEAAAGAAPGGTADPAGSSFH